jgi:hypothetical protein
MSGVFTSNLTEAQQLWIKSARQMIDWLGENPDFIPRNTISLYNWYWDWDFRAINDDEGDLTSDRVERLLDAMRVDAAILRDKAPVGSVEKIDSSDTYGVVRKFGNHKLFLATAASATCTMVPTDMTEEVVTYEIPTDVYEKYKVVKQEPVMKKVCPPITNREL